MNNKHLLNLSKDDFLNTYTLQDYYTRLSLLAKSVYEWSGLPKGIDERFLERILFEDGRALFCDDPDLGLIVTRCSSNGELNLYHEPIKRQSVRIDGKNQTFTIDNSIWVRNNDDEIPTNWTINLYAHRLAEVERTMDINLNAQKTPVLILCGDKQKLTLKQVYKKYQGNEPVIFGDKNLDTAIEQFKVLKTDAPFLVPDLMTYKHDLWNECMTFLGVNNANLDKKERMITNEVEANNDQIMLSSLVMLKARKDAAKKLNEMFGCNVNVRMRSYDEIKSNLSCNEDDEEMEDDDNE